MKNTLVAVFGILLFALVGFAVLYSQKPEMFSKGDAEKEEPTSGFKAISEKHVINDVDRDRFKRAHDLLVETYEKKGLTEIKLIPPEYTKQLTDPEFADPILNLILTRGTGKKGDKLMALHASVRYDPTKEDSALSVLKSNVGEIPDRTTSDRDTDEIMSSVDIAEREKAKKEKEEKEKKKEEEKKE